MPLPTPRWPIPLHQCRYTIIYIISHLFMDYKIMAIQNIEVRRRIWTRSGTQRDGSSSTQFSDLWIVYKRPRIVLPAQWVFMEYGLRTLCLMRLMWPFRLDITPPVLGRLSAAAGPSAEELSAMLFQTIREIQIPGFLDSRFASCFWFAFVSTWLGYAGGNVGARVNFGTSPAIRRQ